MPFEELPHESIRDRMHAIRDAPYRLLMDESVRYANRHSEQGERRIELLGRNAEFLETLIPEEPAGEFQRALAGTSPDELHERLSQTKSCLFTDRTRGAKPRAICAGYATDLETGMELLFARFPDQPTYIRVFHARTVNGPSLFVDAIKGRLFPRSNVQDWSAAGHIDELITSIAGATLLTREEEENIVFGKDEAREIANLAGYAKHPVFTPTQTNKTYGKNQKSKHLHKPTTHYPMIPKTHLDTLTASEFDAYTREIHPHTLKGPLHKRAVITSAYSRITNYASRTL